MHDSYDPVSDTRVRYRTDAETVLSHYEVDGVTVLIGDPSQRYRIPLDSRYEIYVRPAVRGEVHDTRWDAVLDRIEAFGDRLARLKPFRAKV